MLCCTGMALVCALEGVPGLRVCITRWTWRDTKVGEGLYREYGSGMPSFETCNLARYGLKVARADVWVMETV
jgi:hypothetical protein